MRHIVSALITAAALAGALTVLGSEPSPLTCDITGNSSLSIKGKYCDVSLFSNLIAVIPPWRGERFNSSTPTKIEKKNGSVTAVQLPNEKFKDFQLDEYSCAIDGDSALITVRGGLVNAVPTKMFYQALMIPDYLLAGADCTVKFPDGAEKTVKIPAQPEVQDAAELFSGFSEITFTGYRGTLTIRRLSGPVLVFFERRADSIYNPIRGFEVGARWDVEFGKPIESVIEVKFKENAMTPAPVIPPQLGAATRPLAMNRLYTPLAPDYSHLPPPRSIVKNAGLPFTIPSASAMRITGIEHDAAELNRFRRAAERTLSASFPRLRFEPDRRTPPDITVNIAAAANHDDNPESYKIEVTERGITIASPSARGAFHAMQTLKTQVTNGEIPAMTIEDYPEYAFRGIHILLDEDSLDVTGPMIENLFAPLHINAIVAECQYVKWDSTGNIHQKWGASKEQVKKLIEIANDNYIDVYPLFQTLGHSEWLFANGNNRGLAEDPDFPYAYDPSNPELYPLIDAILAEVLETFNRPRYVHIGHDEVYNPVARWPYQPENVAKTAKKLFFDDVMHFYTLGKKLDFEIIMWHDMLVTQEECPENGAGGEPDHISEIRKDLPKDINIAFWRYSAGFDFKDIEKVYGEGFHNLFGATWYDRSNITALCRFGKGRLKGMLQTTWTGYNGNRHAIDREFMQMHPYAQLAMSSWNPDIGLDEADSPTIFCDLMESIRDRETKSGWALDLSQFSSIAFAPGTDPFLTGTLNEFDRLPSGLRCGSVEFRVAEYDHTAAAVSVRSATSPALPETSAQLPVNLKVSDLYFLHTTASTAAKKDAVIGSYEIEYADGTADSAPIIYGKTIGSVFSTVNFSLAPLQSYSWEDNGSTCRIWYQSWCNPKPEVPVKSVTLKSNGGETPIYLLGLSAAGNPETR
ncbi:MAG: glycoside hydrolase family 20 zincin-like fold domain-containing protein [Victivallaceae bacterium]|nr:glycoside hydrolase family 20 zincin-like fold domain-containing protein [Victivallaceae bacterium]